MHGTEPIFIIGAPRSGTTLLTTMLNAHSRIFLANETKVFVRWLPKFRDCPKAGGGSLAREMIDHLSRVEMAGFAPLPGVESFDTLKPPLQLFRDLVEALLSGIAQRRGRQRWGEKTAVSYRQGMAMASVFPDAQYFAMDRDPYQVGRSYESANPDWGFVGGVIHWLECRQSLARMEQSGVVVHRVSYTDLVDRPEQTLRKILQFIGEEYEPGMLEFHKTDYAKTIAVKREFRGVREPLYGDRRCHSPPAGWRAYVSDRARKAASRMEDGYLAMPVWARAAYLFLVPRVLLFRAWRRHGS